MATAAQMAARKKFADMQKNKSKSKVGAAFHEVSTNPPAVVKKTVKNKGVAAAQKQKVAIALSKARKAGAQVPPPTRDQVLAKMAQKAQTS